MKVEGGKLDEFFEDAIEVIGCANVARATPEEWRDFLTEIRDHCDSLLEALGTQLSEQR